MAGAAPSEADFLAMCRGEAEFPEEGFAPDALDLVHPVKKN